MVISAASSRSADQYPSQIIEKSKEKQKEKLARAKQLKDDYAIRKK